MENKNYFIIDICGTLYRSNTTLDFIRFFFEGERWFEVLQKLRRNRAYTYLNAKFFQLWGFDITRRIAISHLKGFTKNEISNMAAKFCEEYLTKVENPTVIDIIKEKREKGFELVIISATLDCISDKVAEHMKIKKHFSSMLEYDDKGICTGRLRYDLLGSKLKKLIDEKIYPRYAGIITDNYSDEDVIKKSEYLYLIQYKDKKNRWSCIIKKLRCGYEYVMV